MKISRLLSILYCIFLFLGCENSENRNFFDKTSQTLTDRLIEYDIEPVMTKPLVDYEILRILNIKSNTNYIFISDFSQYSISIIHKNDLERFSTISFTEGDGPGELRNMQDVSVTEDRIYILDRNQLKIMEVDFDGNLQREIMVSPNPNRVEINPESEQNHFIVYFTNIREPLFRTYDKDGNENMVFGNIENEGVHQMSTSGRIHWSDYDKSLFFVGRAEPVIKKFSNDGSEVFSVANIDNYDTSQSYLTRNFEDGRSAYSFSDDAMFSANYSIVLGERLFIIPFHNQDRSYKYIDIYDTENGEYKKSIKLDRYAGQIAVDNELIYGIGGDTNDKIALKVYENPL